MNFPKKTKVVSKGRRRGGEEEKKRRKLEHLPFKYRKFQLTTRNSIEMKVVPTVSL